MVVVGVVGGVASGKSAVAETLVQWGAVRFDADQAGHEALRHTDVIAALRSRWGDGVLNENGQVDRRVLAKRVFCGDQQGREDLAFLESISHPRIRSAFQAAIRKQLQQPTAVMVVDAALLFEAGWDDLCDIVLFIDLPAEVRRRRAETRGMSAADWKSREDAQLSLREKRVRATHVIRNDGTRADLHDHLAMLAQGWGLTAD